jgi:hypothetical protein
LQLTRVLFFLFFLLSFEQIDESPLDALALYIKALHIHHSISQYVKKAAQSHHHLAYSSRLGLGWLPLFSPPLFSLTSTYTPSFANTFLF